MGIIDNADDDKQTLRNVLTLIEQLRCRRRLEYSGQTHPENKRFTQDELDAVVYHSYKNLLKGRTQRLPSREMLINIAAYLECSPEERNALLLAAQYLQIPTTVSAQQESDLLKEASTLIHQLPFPAYTITQRLSINEANQPFLDLCGLAYLGDIPAERRTELHLVFDPNLPLQSSLSSSEAIKQTNLRTAIVDWRTTYQLLQHQWWYQEMIEQLYTLPCFGDTWEQSQHYETQPAYIYIIADTPLQQPTHMRATTLTLGDNPFPKIALYLPHHPSES
ncbi:MAG: helix-turn-helix transcriptional regulator [Chloroflexi bacterium AL-W]|nr:helix-turn-helix transcriptional regulator [Chloroflexi bacterium AL-N1]NOK69340.1 helix-turn-helix transcriptional regulator [Chloroflexi bacterium AL-N10]NOK76401.1 helix-turn-helix transcriptional regulator [Chloroflexi bacterium AL-N5]NOK83518.1 helix-turn-helix transcriptional regulator [Chloroflexi bacterium AL-W]NOK91178.1 helix-turn-helix transcriptional regulator [Chloroflexi bacterium AL-N15]